MQSLAERLCDGERAHRVNEREREREILHILMKTLFFYLIRHCWNWKYFLFEIWSSIGSLLNFTRSRFDRRFVFVFYWLNGRHSLLRSWWIIANEVDDFGIADAIPFHIDRAPYCNHLRFSYRECKDIDTASGRASDLSWFDLFWIGSIWFFDDESRPKQTKPKWIKYIKSGGKTSKTAKQLILVLWIRTFCAIRCSTEVIAVRLQFAVCFCRLIMLDPLKSNVVTAVIVVCYLGVFFLRRHVVVFSFFLNFVSYRIYSMIYHLLISSIFIT